MGFSVHQPRPSLRPKPSMHTACLCRFLNKICEVGCGRPTVSKLLSGHGSHTLPAHGISGFSLQLTELISHVHLCLEACSPTPLETYLSLSTQHSGLALSTQHSVLRSQCSAPCTQYSALRSQHSAPSTQYSALSTQVTCCFFSEVGPEHFCLPLGWILE